MLNVAILMLQGMVLQGGTAAAAWNAQFNFPQWRITVNLAPAESQK